MDDVEDLSVSLRDQTLNEVRPYLPTSPTRRLPAISNQRSPMIEPRLKRGLNQAVDYEDDDNEDEEDNDDYEEDEDEEDNDDYDEERAEKYWQHRKFSSLLEGANFNQARTYIEEGYIDLNDQNSRIDWLTILLIQLQRDPTFDEDDDFNFLLTLIAPLASRDISNEPMIDDADFYQDVMGAASVTNNPAKYGKLVAESFDNFFDHLFEHSNEPWIYPFMEGLFTSDNIQKFRENADYFDKAYQEVKRYYDLDNDDLYTYMWQLANLTKSALKM